MTTKEMLAMFDGFSEGLLTVLADSERMKKQVLALMEENTRLRLENRQLQDVIQELEASKVAATSGDKPSHQGRKYLETIYDEGFHVCNDFYGQSRGNSEECGFCMELLYRD